MKSLRQWLVFLGCFLLLWQLLAMVLSNAILCPSPVQVFREMRQQLTSPGFFTAVRATVYRMLISLWISFACGLLGAGIAYFCKRTAFIFNRIVLILQSIPNMVYIILILFWTSRQNAVILVSFFLLFPMIYRNFYETFMEMSRKWKDVFLLYPQPWYIIVSKAFLPAMKPAFSSALKSAGSLAFKAGIMAEILASVPSGIGRSMQSARLSVNVAGVMGWCVWLLILVFGFEWIWNRMIAFLFDRQTRFHQERTR